MPSFLSRRSNATAEVLARESRLKTSIKERLVESVKDLQAEYSHRTHVAITSNEVSDAFLSNLEAIFIHALKDSFLGKLTSALGSTEAAKNNNPEPNFWLYLLIFSHRETIERIETKLRQISTDVGRCRAWVRLAMNDGLLGSYLRAMARDRTSARHHYHAYAFMRDAEFLDITIRYIEGIEIFNYDLACNSGLLNHWQIKTLIMAGLLPPSSNEVVTVAIDAATLEDEEAATAAVELPEEGLSNNIRPIGRQGFLSRGLLNEDEALRLILQSSSPITSSPVLSSSPSVYKYVGTPLAKTPPKNTPPKSTTPLKNTPPPLPTPKESPPKENDSKETAKPSDEMPPNTTTSDLDTTLYHSIYSHGDDEDEDEDDEKEVVPKSGSEEERDTGTEGNGTKENEIGGKTNALTSKEEEIGRETNNDALTSKEDEEIGSASTSKEDEIGRESNALTSKEEDEIESASTSKEEEEEEEEFHTPDPITTSRTQTPNSTREHERLLPRLSGFIDAWNGRDRYFDTPPDDNDTASESCGFTLKSDVSIGKLNVEDSKFMMSLFDRVAREKGLDSQNYECFDCSKAIGTIFGAFKVCAFTKKYYCEDCHRDDLHPIPFKVVYNWDFNPGKVCIKAKTFLETIAIEPIIDVKSSTLFGFATDLDSVYTMRKKLYYMDAYLTTCTRNPEVKRRLDKSLYPREYLYSDVDLYSLRDFEQIHDGTLKPLLKNALKLGSDHILKCIVCKGRGFICEICKNPKILYPFDLELISQCEKCFAVYHRECSAKVATCPKCDRIEARNLNWHVNNVKIQKKNPKCDKK